MQWLNKLAESDIREALVYDLHLDDSRIIVKADHGRVTLSGTVDSDLEVELAAVDARSASVVDAIDNQLVVGPIGDAAADGAIAVAARDALDQHRMVPQGSVQATVADGCITLTGQVHHHIERQAAQHAVRHIPGVLGVMNAITMSDEPIPPDVVSRIEKAITGNATIDDTVIKVTNRGHTIYLDGVVNSFDAMVVVLDTAWAAPGVKEVVNNLNLIE